MKRDLHGTGFAAAAAIAGLMLMAVALIAAPIGAEEEEKRVVKRIRIECDGADCEQHKEHAGHAIAWSSGDHPHRFMFESHMGGGYLGVLLAELTPELRTHFGVAEDAGVMISRVVDDSPAAKAGLRVGDIITAVDSERIGSGQELARSIRGKEDGASVLLAVWRDGAVENLTATVEVREGGPHAMEHAFVLKCDDDESDCKFARRGFKAHSDWDLDFECEGEGPCEVQVKCDDAGDCDCTVNGEETDCSELPGFDG